MSAVLGVSAHYHDAAAALIVDGELVAAIQQERLSRIKNDPSLPLEAIDACLARAGIEGPALDAVVFYEQPFDKLERVLVNLMRNLPRTWRQFPRAMASQLGLIDMKQMMQGAAGGADRGVITGSDRIERRPLCCWRPGTSTG